MHCNNFTSTQLITIIMILEPRCKKLEQRQTEFKKLKILLKTRIYISLWMARFREPDASIQLNFKSVLIKYILQSCVKVRHPSQLNSANDNSKSENKKCWQISHQLFIKIISNWHLNSCTDSFHIYSSIWSNL